MSDQPKTILVVEDDQVFLEILIDELSKAGFKVVTAHDGEEGLQAALGQLPDLIVIDILMPKMDGITMLKKIRESEAGKKIPLLILTNLSDNQTIDTALENGAYDFLVKSDWEPKDLVKRIKEKLGVNI